MKILIAEDNAFSRTLLKKTLVKAGFEVLAVENGAEAWEVLRGENPPKLALIDWMMPGVSGIELCRKVRALDSVMPTYLIFLSAKSDKEDVLEGFAAGADDFIKKPFDGGELLARVQVGRRLVEQQALMYCLIDSIPDPIYVKDSRGVYLGCNSAYAKFAGLASEEIHSLSAVDVLPEEEAKSAHMQDLRVLAEGDPFSVEGWVSDSRGEKVYHDTLKIPYIESAVGSKGMISISRDLTKRMEMEQELQRLAVAVQQSTESIMIMNVDRTILYVNHAFERDTGHAAKNVLGRDPGFLRCDGADGALFDELWDTVDSGRTWEGELVKKRVDGSVFVEEAVVYPIRDASDKVFNYVAISHDITQEREMEKHLRQQSKMNAIGELAGGVSHDFNNILTAILGYVALCMRSVDEQDKIYGYLQEIVNAGDRATQLVRRILTFSRQEEQNFRSIQLGPIIEETLSMVRTTMRENVSIERFIDPTCGEIRGDTTQMQQVILNLCTNASHALGAERAGELKVELRRVEIVDGKLGDRPVDLNNGFYARVMVADTGCGMPPEVLERVFEPYFTTRKKREGTGFGLSIVHGIVRKHRGLITVDSAEGVGSVFTMYFPLLEKAVREATDAPNSARVLFVDDDEVVLSMGREMLESFGFSVVTAVDGPTALDALEHEGETFDALVTDYSMPDMNGYDLIKAAHRVRADLPAILCSGYMEKVEGEELDRLGHAAYVEKPVDWSELSRAIRAFMADR